MPVDILVPPLSQTADSLLLLEWLKKPGDKVTKGEALFTVETDKASLEVEAPESGILYEVYAQPQTEIAVRSVIGIILKESEAAPQKTDVAHTEAPPHVKKTAQPEEIKDNHKMPSDQKPAGRLFASPRARKLADEMNLNLSPAVPTGTRGMVVERDAHLLLEKEHQAEKTETAPMSHIRQVIAKRMLDSHPGTAPVTYMSEADATELVALRKQVVDELSGNNIRPTFTDFFIRIACLALRQHPQLNATFENGQITMHDCVNLALAVDTDRGLIVPVLRDAEQLSLKQVTTRRKEIVERAIQGNSQTDELTGGTFTLTNLGALGVDFFTPIVNPPQIAILGIGRIREVPAVKDGGIFIRNLVSLALTCDHRMIDGAPAARFLNSVSQLVEKPDKGWL